MTGNINEGVKCNVSSCVHFDDHYCTASKIEVGTTCTDCNCEKDTMCQTYEIR